jgi:hypothetical protein
VKRVALGSRPDAFVGLPLAEAGEIDLDPEGGGAVGGDVHDLLVEAGHQVRIASATDA